MRQIYLDYNAATPLAPEVQQALTPFVANHFADPAAGHPAGRAVFQALAQAQQAAATALGAWTEEFCWTSGGTEAANLAILGTMLAFPPAQAHLVLSNLEHSCTTACAKFLGDRGYAVTTVPCNRHGVVDARAIQSALRPTTRLVSLIHAHHLLGTLQPVRKVVEFCRPRRILVHTDAAQSIGKIPVRVGELGIDLMSFSGRKLYAPSGIGGLFVRRGTALLPLLQGDSLDGGLRPGVPNVPGAIGLARALQLAVSQLDVHQSTWTSLRARLWEQLRAGIGPKLLAPGLEQPNLTNTLCLVFPDVEAKSLLQRCSELAAFSEPPVADSPYTWQQRTGVVRLSLGWQTTRDEIDHAASLLIAAWEALRP